MAWKVYGFMEGKEGNKRFPNRDLPVYGPLPCKRWIAQPGERYRVSHAKPTFRSAETPTEYNERRAVTYACWLAARDGIALSGRGRAIHETFQSEISGKLIKRIAAVQFNNHRVSIPHWDFEPREPVEHFDHEPATLENIFA